MKSKSICMFLSLAVAAGCGEEDAPNVEVRTATTAECPGGGIVLVDEGTPYLVCEGGAQGPAGPTGPQGPAGPQGEPGPSAAAVDSLGAVTSLLFCNRFEGESNFGYDATVYFFTSGFTFSNINFSTPLASASKAGFHPPNSNPSATFVDGLDDALIRLDGVFTQTVDLQGGRWTMTQATNTYFNVPFTDPEYCFDGR